MDAGQTQAGDASREVPDVESASGEKTAEGTAKSKRRCIAAFNSGAPFLVPMGTGSIIQVLVNFPYPASWLHDLGYLFWILDIILFILLSSLAALAISMDRARATGAAVSFPQAALLGPIPIAFDTIIMGVVSFYPQMQGAVWAAFGMYWAAVAMTLSTVAAAVAALHRHRHDTTEITGAWLLAFIPPIVTAATGAHIAVLPSATASLPVTLVPSLLLTSFLLLAFGLTFCLLLVPLYIRRLLTASLPPSSAIASTFVPAGPLGMGAYAMHALSRALAQYLDAVAFTPLLGGGGAPAPADVLSTAQTAAVATTAAAVCVRWLGVIEALVLLAPGAGFVLHALGACIARPPREYGVGVWACVFPVAVWANAAARLGLDLGNEGLKGVGAAAGVLALGLWAGCAAGSASSAFRTCVRSWRKSVAPGWYPKIFGRRSVGSSNG